MFVIPVFISVRVLMIDVLHSQRESFVPLDCLCTPFLAFIVLINKGLKPICKEQHVGGSW